MQTNEQKNLYSEKNIIFPNVSSYNKLIDIKNIFVTKDFLLCENVCRSHVKSVSVASLEAPIQRCSLMKYGGSIGRYSFRPAVLNIFVKFLQKH